MRRSGSPSSPGARSEGSATPSRSVTTIPTSPSWPGPRRHPSAVGSGMDAGEGRAGRPDSRLEPARDGPGVGGGGRHPAHPGRGGPHRRCVKGGRPCRHGFLRVRAATVRRGWPTTAQTSGRRRRTHTSEARRGPGGLLAPLGERLVGHQPDDDLLEDVTRKVDAIVPLLEAAPHRSHAFFEHGPAIFSSALGEGWGPSPATPSPTASCPGSANPMGVAARLWREGEEAVCQVTLGPAFEGARDGRTAGMVAALIDETMGLVLSISTTPAFTGRLTVTYRAPTPLGRAAGGAGPAGRPHRPQAHRDGRAAPRRAGCWPRPRASSSPSNPSTSSPTSRSVSS